MELFKKKMYCLVLFSSLRFFYCQFNANGTVEGIITSVSSITIERTDDNDIYIDLVVVYITPSLTNLQINIVNYLHECELQ